MAASLACLFTSLLTETRFFGHSSARPVTQRRAMLQWFQRLMPRQNVFFPAFERHAAVIVKTAMALREMVADGE